MGARETAEQSVSPFSFSVFLSFSRARCSAYRIYISEDYRLSITASFKFIAMDTGAYVLLDERWEECERFTNERWRKCERRWDYCDRKGGRNVKHCSSLVHDYAVVLGQDLSEDVQCMVPLHAPVTDQGVVVAAFRCQMVHPS